VHQRPRAPAPTAPAGPGPAARRSRGRTTPVALPCSAGRSGGAPPRSSASAPRPWPPFLARWARSRRRARVCWEFQRRLRRAVLDVGAPRPRRRGVSGERGAVGLRFPTPAALMRAPFAPYDTAMDGRALSLMHPDRGRPLRVVTCERREAGGSSTATAVAAPAPLPFSSALELSGPGARRSWCGRRSAAITLAAASPSACPAVAAPACGG